MLLKQIELFTAVCTIMVLMALVAAVPADAAPRQIDVFCDWGTFDNCTDTLIIVEANENFDCVGTPQTDNVLCTSQQTSEVFDCEFVGTIGQADQYSCTEIEEEQQQTGQQQPGQQQEPSQQQEPAVGEGGGPITQEGEQESEAGEIDQTFEVS